MRSERRRTMVAPIGKGLVDTVKASALASLPRPWLLVGVLLLSVCWSGLVSAGNFTVFGPQVYQRQSGQPVTETASFPTFNPGAPYTLNIYNGGLEDDEVTGDLVSSATFQLNGVLVVGSNSFNQNVSVVSGAVTLQSNNTLAVQLRGKPGGVVLVEIVGVDVDLPTITATVTPPPDSAGWNTTAVTVSFACFDATSGIASCTDPVVLSSAGVGQVVTGTAVDNAGNTATTTVTVNIRFDSDGDGISDAADQCPSTPAGESVNAAGCSASQLDSDNDGISDAADQCPATPAGESVDANGCSASQLDEDGDGVSDADDQCPATLAGESVDANGCSATQLDDDNDGVSDADDQCPATPAGESVDASGCSASQLDEDNDGISDAVDACPATPAGESVDANGCSATQLDSDNDGVSDADDQCPATPAGESVDTNGCSTSQLDEDGDGVLDAADQCPGTPTGETVDSAGCGASQLDSDGDGVTDVDDDCPGTPSGEIVDAFGCSDSQLDFDNDGISDALDLCPGTPLGETVDANGCAAGQVDSDNDGVFDDVDQCPGTAPGDPVDADGCSAAQGGSGPIPPDPSTVAPVIDPTIPTTNFTANEFLYTGPDAIQTGVVPGTIELVRAAVLRGTVLDRTGLPLPGVTITVLNHSEFGQTLSRADGLFDLAVNGGGPLTVVYERAGFFPVQRKVSPDWQSFAWLPDVVLIQPDPQVTTVDLSSGAAIQVASGSAVTDVDGTRQATLMFSSGTSAQMVFANGSTQSLSTLNVRATEYTVGENGPETMPGELPPSSGYTYAVDLSVDEALAAGATEVSFSRPVMVYVDNFVGFPVGEAVPAGYYDRSQAAWVPSMNGRVIKILGSAGGLADLDIDGTGIPADAASLAALQFTDAERTQLALSYIAGTSLWRIPVTHFTPWDFNWSFGPPLDAEEPESPAPGSPGGPPGGPGGGGPGGGGGQEEGGPPQEDKSECEINSIIESQNQTLGETIEVVGTPFTLNYRSDRVPGRTAAYTIRFGVTDNDPPLNLKRADIEVQVGGRRITDSVAALPNQTYSYVWDGKDIYGRALYGAQPAKVIIGYVYDPVYYATATEFNQSFDAFGTTPFPGIRARGEIILQQELDFTIGTWDARMQGFGGWSLDIHHGYDVSSRTVYLGNGGRRSAEQLPNVVVTIAGNGELGAAGIGGPATEAQLFFPQGIAVGPDGSFYIAENANHRITKVDPNGVISLVAGIGTAGFSGDGGDATLAELDNPISVAIGPVGSVYIADAGNNRVRRVAPDGIISTVAGSGPTGFLGAQISGDGGPAVDAVISSPEHVAVAPDGTLFIADFYNDRIRRVTADGLIDTYFINTFGLQRIRSLALDPNGALYASLEGGSPFVIRIMPDGSTEIVAGTGSPGFGGDGGLATNALFNSPRHIAVSDDGTVYIADLNNARIRKISPDGIISTIVGSGELQFIGEGAARQIGIGPVRGLALAPNGDLYFSNANAARVFKVTSVLPDLGADDIAIAAEDGSEIYIFSNEGRHLRTLNALTGAVVYLFNYDTNGYVDLITDGDGNVYQIQRYGDGVPYSIVGPDGQTTSLLLNIDGFLTDIANPASESYTAGYTSDGLTTSFTDPRGGTANMTYHPSGRLQRDTNAAFGYFDLVHTQTATGYEVEMVSAEGRVTNLAVEGLPTGERLRTNTYPDGTVVQTLIDDDGGATTITRADGTVSTRTDGADPRLGMQAPIPARVEITTPSGLARVTTTARITNLSDPTNLFSIVDQTDTVTINGRVYISDYDGQTQTYTNTTPEGRRVFITVDTQGRTIIQQIEGLEPTQFGYDPRGRVVSIIEGTTVNARETLLTYDLDGYVETITDALGRTVDFDYDTSGRLIQQTSPNNRIVQYAYDANGNVILITPPDRTAHLFNYTPVNLEEVYDPPKVGAGSDITQYIYNLDKQITQVLRPDGKTIDYTYNTGGQRTRMLISRGPIDYTYDAQTGNLASIAAPNGASLTYTYDGALLLSQTWTGPVAGAVSRQYDNDFRVISQSVNGSPVAFAHDNDGLLNQAGALTLARDSLHGLLTGTSLGNTDTFLGYNGFGELSGHTADYGNTILYDVTYSRDGLGRITQKTETIQGTTTAYVYAYDLASRLAEVKKNSVVAASYAYDGNGNRVSRTTPGGTETGVYDAQDRLVSYDGATYTYTANGELRTKTEDGVTTTYTYDVLGNLITVTLPGGMNIGYVIDGRNRRIGKKVNGTLSQGFLYKDRLNPIAELNGTGAVVSRFIYGARSNVPGYMVKGGATYRIISDHLGSPRLVVNTSDGSIAQRMDYDEFGNITLDTNPGFQPFGFAGGLYDLHTRLVRFGARDYDPGIGRWVSKDPIGFDGGLANLYSYVSEDPVNNTDFSGLLKPGGQWPIYDSGDYQQGVNEITQGIIDNDPSISPEKAGEIANDIMKEMTLAEAKKLNDLKEKGDEDGIKDLLQEIFDRAKCKK